MFASETCALDVVGAKFVRDVEPGEIVRVKDGKLLSKIYTKDPLQDKICAMEYIYFSTFILLEINSSIVDVSTP